VALAVPFLDPVMKDYLAIPYSPLGRLDGFELENGKAVIGYSKAIGRVPARHAKVGMVFDQVRMVTISEKVAEPYAVAAFPKHEDQQGSYHKQGEHVPPFSLSEACYPRAARARNAGFCAIHKDLLNILNLFERGF